MVREMEVKLKEENINKRELTEITEELLERTSFIKNSYKKSMTAGKEGIIEGVVIFEEVVKEINPDTCSMAIVEVIENKVMAYLHSRRRIIDVNIDSGLYACFMMLETYVKICLGNVNETFDVNTDSPMVRLRVLD